MPVLDAAQRRWLEALGVLVSGASVQSGAAWAEEAPSQARGGAADMRRAAPGTADADLPKKAKVISLGITRTQYDFGRPITREQAAQVLFRAGKVPDEAELLPGPGANSWTLQARDLESWQSTLKKMRARRQTVTTGKPNPATAGDGWVPPPPDEVTDEWGDDTAPAAKGAPRPDPAKDAGFKISKHYPLDEGKSPVKHVQSPLGLGRGHGYEIVFATPVMRAQVMDALFGKNSLGEGTVYLKPDGDAPRTTWQVHVIGVDALAAFRRPAFRAIAAANTQTPDSIAPDVPKGIRDHILKKTVPPNATRHPPDVHVWEQEKHLVRVKTDGKGGYYQYETTALTDSDEASNITIRYFMVEQGLPAREAWQEYVKHWDWIHKQILGALAQTLSSIGLPGRAPPIAVATPRRRPSVPQDKGGGRARTSSQEGALADTLPAPKPAAKGLVPKDASTGGNSLPPAKPAKPAVTAGTQAENARVAGYKTPRVQPSPGDGEPVPLDKAFGEMKKKPGNVLESNSDSFHRTIWQEYMGLKGDPPIAFRYSGRVRVNIEKLSPAQRQTFIKLGKP